jgi:glycosyltransferase involved in cell wall biosynthesis
VAVKIALVSCVSGVATPPSDYGGIEAEVAYLADEFVARGHQVTVYGIPNEAHERSTGVGWRTERLLTEADALTHVDELRAFDVVQDLSHSKPLRIVKLPKYYATTMWTDNPAGLGRDIFPSESVRAAFTAVPDGASLWTAGLPEGRVIPLGIPVTGMGEPSDFKRRGFVCVGRVAPIKGQDIALAIAQRHGMGGADQLTVAGHVGAYGDLYFAMGIQRGCARTNSVWRPNPSSAEISAMLQGARGLIHTHRWIESFSLVVAEALCRGTPVLTSDVGAPQEWTRATDGGFAAPLRSLEAYRMGDAETPQLKRVLDGFFDMAEGSGRLAIAKRARKMFDIKVIAARYEKEVYGW